MKKAKIVVRLQVSDIWDCRVYMRRLWFFWQFVDGFTVWRLYAQSGPDLVALLEKELTQRGFDKKEFIIEFKKIL